MDSGSSSGITGKGQPQSLGSLGTTDTVSTGSRDVDVAYFKGEEAKALPGGEPPGSSDLTSVLDEVGAAAAERLKHKDKEKEKPVSKRTASTECKENTEESEAIQETPKATSQVETSKEIKEKFKELLPDMNEGKLEEFLERLGEREEDLANYSDAKMLKEAKEFFRDPSHQYAAIEYARAKIKEALENPHLSGPERDRKANLLLLLQKGSNRLLREEGTAVRAGLNVSALAAVSEQEGLGTIDGLRNMYRNDILGHQSIVETFKIMVKFFGSARMTEGTQFVLKAASTDLEAQPSSIEKGKLHDIVGDIYKMQTLAGMFNRIAQFLNILEKEPPIVPPAG